jgi:hypothetical protein
VCAVAALARASPNIKVKKARASPKLKHEHTCHKLTTKFLTETNIKRLIAVRNKNKIARNKMKNERNQMYRK